jgi:hypothetical protein
MEVSFVFGSCSMTARPNAALSLIKARAARAVMVGLDACSASEEAAVNNKSDTADGQGAPRPSQEQQAQAQAPIGRKPPLRARVRDVLEKLRPFPACD